ncbi:sulfotransferase family 2 domain-containing protein [Christiangramia sp. SM2212]|uniref:Sulfotransferase family 2 domain-containing protein n=1 Tax=Christiangramia sediminicola TaxID=3073267 RepID=A0ABU1ELV9_9FLAO|nr:sulfotransferase family 2 domain-containing protein [Christiangramia sp. SM2212]MDR5589334.1 sulfotransferase family 2 domain-containing protein [Christiangramia sp. SM2212]
MVSHKHKTIFIHIPKAAGTSVERAFMEDLNIDMENRHSLLLGLSSNKTIGPKRISHLTATQLVKGHYISEQIFKDYFKFAIVRNPYDRLYSTYKFFHYNEYFSFDNFILKILDRYLDSEHVHNYFLLPQVNYICNEKGDLLVDFIGKLENLKNDFETVKSEIGFKTLELKHYNKSNRRLAYHALIRKMADDFSHFRSFSFARKRTRYLSYEAIEKINYIYSVDFEYFNYDKTYS